MDSADIQKRQRIYDAMLIKAFRADVTTGKLNWWLTPYGIHTPDKDLLRQPPAVNFRVQSFVGKYLKPLADRLWDTSKDRDIETLDWMRNLDSQDTERVQRNELNAAARERTRHSEKRQLLATKAKEHLRSNQWFVTKGKT